MFLAYFCPVFSGGVFLFCRGPRRSQGMEWCQARNRAHKLLTHKLFESSGDPGTTSLLTTRKNIFWVRRRTHEGFSPVNRKVVPRSTGPSHQSKMFMFMCLCVFLRWRMEWPLPRARSCKRVKVNVENCGFYYNSLLNSAEISIFEQKVCSQRHIFK